VYQAAAAMPSLQSQVRFAEYRVELGPEGGRPQDTQRAIAGLLAAETLPWHHHRDTGQRSYDLRALIDDLHLAGESTVEMRLRCDSGGSGRPEQVILALGMTGRPRSIHRTGLSLETSSH
jgi:hypothetical protein